ncbi:MAG: spore germination protein GerPC [Paenibacillaceae bacterium]
MNPLQTQQLFHHLHWQSQKLLQLEQSMQTILHELEALKKPSTPTVDKIEYHFDQLKIEKLEGTLNIGITPGQGKSIEDLSVNGQTIDERSTEIQQESLHFSRIQKNVANFLDTDVPVELQKLSNQYNLVLDHKQHTFIIEDLRKQIDERIRYYHSETAITERVKKDIVGGLNQYLSKLSESERESK